MKEEEQAIGEMMDEKADVKRARGEARIRRVQENAARRVEKTEEPEKCKRIQEQADKTVDRIQEQTDKQVEKINEEMEKIAREVYEGDASKYSAKAAARKTTRPDHTNK